MIWLTGRIMLAFWRVLGYIYYIVSVKSTAPSSLHTPTLKSTPRALQATMTANTKQDAFDRLPEELRIEIMKLSPDPFRYGA